MAITLAPSLVDEALPQWIHGELNGVANAPGLPESVAELIARHTEVFFAWRNATHAARSAEAAAEMAVKVDADHRSRALATNRPAPKPQTPEAVKAREDAQRHEADLRRALAMVEDAIKADIAAHNDGWLVAIVDETQRLHADILRRNDEDAADFRRLAELAKVQAVVRSPHAPKIWSAFDMSLPGVAVDEHVTHALGVLRNAVRPPTPVVAVEGGNYDAQPVKVFG